MSTSEINGLLVIAAEGQSCLGFRNRRVAGPFGELRRSTDVVGPVSRSPRRWTSPEVMDPDRPAS